MAVLIIFPLTLQTVINVRMLSISLDRPTGHLAGSLAGLNKGP